MATRIWRVCKAAGRPFPQVSEDDVLDYLVTEAVAVKVSKEDEEQEKKSKREEFKRGKPGDDLPAGVER